MLALLLVAAGVGLLFRAWQQPQRHWPPVVEIGAYVPDRLVWYDAIQYNAAGKETKPLGWPDGDVGMQIYASSYRLHFGHFGSSSFIGASLLVNGLIFFALLALVISLRRQAPPNSAYPHA